MRKIIAVIILGSICAFLFYNLSGNDCFFLFGSVVAFGLVSKIIEWHKKRKLDSIESRILYIVIGVSILANIIPLFDLLIMSAAGLAYAIYDEYNNDTTTNDKTA